MAPPSTPAQPRFLLPKSQKQKSATPLPSGPHQFASTPRFNVSKTTPRQETTSHQPPPFSTPAPPTARARATQYESLSDSIDTSPISPDLPRDGSRQGILSSESIEIESQSPFASIDEPEDDRMVERPQKRRRVSISPVVDATPEGEETHEPMAMDNVSIEFDNTQLSDDHHQREISTSESRAESEDPPSPTEPPTRHPTFLSAPRFKVSEASELATDRPPLPEAFSPQRRGAKYVTGGLAAEVRDWLVQVKGASEYDRPMGDNLRLTVDQVSHSLHGGMCMVSGGEVEGGDGADGTTRHNEARESKSTRVILAGDGRIPGLGSRTVVAQGVTVSMYQPMWDVNLQDLGRFAVACDWEGEGQDS